MHCVNNLVQINIKVVIIQLPSVVTIAIMFYPFIANNIVSIQVRWPGLLKPWGQYPRSGGSPQATTSCCTSVCVLRALTRTQNTHTCTKGLFAA